MESRRETVRRWLVRGTRKPLAVVTPRSGLPPAVPLTAVAPRGQRARLAFGIVLLGEPATLLRLGCVGLIVAGVLGLKMVS